MPSVWKRHTTNWPVAATGSRNRCGRRDRDHAADPPTGRGMRIRELLFDNLGHMHGAVGIGDPCCSWWEYAEWSTPPGRLGVPGRVDGTIEVPCVICVTHSSHGCSRGLSDRLRWVPCLFFAPCRQICTTPLFSAASKYPPIY